MSDIQIPTAVTDLLGPIVDEELLEGGVVSRTRRLIAADGRTGILKERDDTPADLYPLEAEGLDALRVGGGPFVPQVLAVDAKFLLLEDLGPKPELTDRFWVEFGRSVARLHAHTRPQFGFHHDNYLGRLKMNNTWSDDGHAFFAETRLLRFLEVPLCDETLSAEDRAAVERIAHRLPDLIPSQPPSLLHGDLWIGNMLATADGAPAAIDPAVHYGWPEAELAMTWQYRNVPDVFFDGYRELHPLEPDWEERMEILAIREWLSMLAHLGDTHRTMERLRPTLAKFG